MPAAPTARVEAAPQKPNQTMRLHQAVRSQETKPHEAVARPWLATQKSLQRMRTHQAISAAACLRGGTDIPAAPTAAPTARVEADLVAGVEAAPDPGSCRWGHASGVVPWYRRRS